VSDERVPQDALMDYQRGHSRFTPEPAPQESDEATADLAKTILAYLTAHQRQVFEMRAMAGMPHKEIGAIMWPDAPAKVQRNRSRSVYTYTLQKIRHLTASPEDVFESLRRKEQARVEAVRRSVSKSLGGPLSSALFDAITLDATHSGASHSI
jgi:hypothetical protein